MEQTDTIRLIKDAENAIREEYRSAEAKLRAREVALEKQEAKWRTISSGLIESLVKAGNVDPDELPDIDAVLQENFKLLEEAFKFKKLFELINENVLLKSQWDKLVMSIRLVGGDQND